MLPQWIASRAGAGRARGQRSLNILVLHNVANFSTTLRNIADYALCFQRYAPEHNYFYHKITEPVTEPMRRMRCDVVIIDSTALGACRYRPVEYWYAEKERYSFIGESDAVKLVFPQDDYHMSAVMDELFHDWNVDIIYSVIPDRHAMLYPRASARSRIEVVLTGYVDDNSIGDVAGFVLPFEQRRFDLGQRVTFYSPVGGRYAQLKGKLAEAAKDQALRAGLQVNISTRDEDRIYGDDWFQFLGNCRYVTGCESGVSLWDPDGAIYDRVRAFEKAHPGASFEEAEQACFPGADGRHVFNAISPRLFEAAMMKCGQILVEAPYLGVLEPHEHYIPVKPDLSDIEDAVAQMRDHAGARRRIAACYAALIATPQFRYSTLVKRVMADIEGLMAGRSPGGAMPGRQFRRLGARHEAELARIEQQAIARKRWEESRQRMQSVRRRIDRLLAMPRKALAGGGRLGRRIVTRLRRR